MKKLRTDHSLSLSPGLPACRAEAWLSPEKKKWLSLFHKVKFFVFPLPPSPPRCRPKYFSFFLPKSPPLRGLPRGGPWWSLNWRFVLDGNRAWGPIEQL